MCTQSISENVVKKLFFEQFGNITKLQEALQSKATFPHISLDERHHIGKKRIDILCTYLL